MIRLLVVDDSPLMRRLLSGIFSAEGDFVVETARDGTEAIVKLHDFRPDVVTMDIHMPGLDGLASLDRIMIERPTPVVMLASPTEKGADATLAAMALGAVDFVAKPGGAISLEIEALAPALVATVRRAAAARLSRTARLAERIRFRTGQRPPVRAAGRDGASRSPSPSSSPSPPPPSRLAGGRDGLVLIGTSTGGPPALEAVLTGLPANFPWPILIAQHMPASFTGPLARRLDGICALRIEEVTRPTPLVAGHAYIGRGNADLLVTRRAAGLFALPAPESADYLWHPSVDRLVASAMQHVAPDRLIGVLMTGMGDDGAQTMATLNRAGGATIAEAEDSAVVWGMPAALVRLGGAGQVLALPQIGAALAALVPAG